MWYNLGCVYSSLPELTVVQPWVCLQFSTGGCCGTTLGVSTVLCRSVLWYNLGCVYSSMLGASCGITLGVSTVLCRSLLWYNLGCVFSSLLGGVVVQPWVLCLQFSAGGCCEIISTPLCHTTQQTSMCRQKRTLYETSTIWQHRKTSTTTNG